MEPWVKVTFVKAVWPYAWFRYVPELGFKPAECCARALKGAFAPIILWEKHNDGDVFEGNLVFKTPRVYGCFVHRSYDLAKNIHLPMRRNTRSKWVIETDEIRIECRGLQRVLPIAPVPDDVAALIDPKRARCRCWQWAYGNWPQCFKPPGEATNKPAVRQQSLFPDE